jgi:predicted PurR-regulated permease PerM
MSQSPFSFPPLLKKGLRFPIFFLNGWLVVLLINYLEPMFSIFIVAIVLAILLEFPVQFLQQRGLARSWSLLLVLILGLILIVLLGVILIPALLNQIAELIDLLPSWVDSVKKIIFNLEQLPLLENININWVSLQEMMTTQLTMFGQALAKNLLNLLSGSLGSGLNLFFTVVMTIFLLIGGQRVWDGILLWLPPWWQERLRQQVPLKIRRFIGGQVMIATGFSLLLAIIFTLIAVPLGLLFGFLIGMASLIPFMGAIAQISFSLFFMLSDFRTGIEVFIIAFVVGQIVDNVVSPRVMGGLVGVNPIWLLVAVFLGAKLKGIVGLLLAVPIASVIKTIGDDLRVERQSHQAAVLAPQEEFKNE